MQRAILSALLFANMVCLPALAETSMAAKTDPIKQTAPIAIPLKNDKTAAPIANNPLFAREGEAAAAVPATSAPASNAKIFCPAELRNLVAVDNKDTNSWAVGGPEQTAPLKGARVYAGPVSEKTMERYNELTAIPAMNREKGEFEQVWSFDESLIAAGVMMVCDYAGSNHFLMRQIPPGTKNCKEIDAVDKSDTSPTTVECQ